MRILIDILHPAHVHFFRNFHAEMSERGHELCITARAKDRSVELLEHYELPYQQISVQKRGSVGMVTELAARTASLLRVMQRFRPDVMTGIMGPSIALAGAARKVPSVVFYDTEFAWQTNWFTYPLAHSVVTPDCYEGKVKGTQVEYPGYHELAYLHPNRFTPDPSRLAGFGIEPGEPYFVLRFVSWEASHDGRERGMTAVKKRKLIQLLARRGRVVISSEQPVGPELAEYVSRGPVEDIHHLLAHAQLVVGESATMSSEAAVLGVPAVMIATTGRGYTDDEERRYGLVRYFREHQYDEALAAVEEYADDSPRELGALAREQLLREKIDVTDWMVDYFESSFSNAGRR
jgi:uncharacterized protein